MENIGWILYLCNVLENVGIFLGITGALSLLAFIIYVFNADIEKHPIKYRYIIPSIILLFLCTLTPSRSTCYLIFGVTETAKYINSNDEIKKLPDNAVKALNYWLEEQTKEDKKE